MIHRHSYARNLCACSLCNRAIPKSEFVADGTLECSGPLAPELLCFPCAMHNLRTLYETRGLPRAWFKLYSRAALAAVRESANVD